MARRLQPTVSVWHRHLERAEFEPFTWRDHTGPRAVRGPVADRGQAIPRARLAGVLADPAAMDDHGCLGVQSDTAVGNRLRRSLDKAFRVKLARRWLVERPLQRHWDRVDEAISATRKTRA
jgi:hypothetical protein